MQGRGLWMEKGAQVVRVGMFIIGVSFGLLGTAHAADTTAPTAPTALAAPSRTATQINLTWTASTDNVGVTGYRIERCTGSTCTNFAQIATSTTTAYNNAGLTPVTTYRYRLRANDAAGNLSAYSTSKSVATLADTTVPSTPTALTVTAPSSTQVTLTWAASTDNVGVTGYRIERCTGSACTSFTQIATSTTTSYSNTGLTASTTYRYRVRANDAAGNLSAYSSMVNGTTPSAADTTPPTVPANLTATATSTTQVNLSWSASTDNVAVTNYLIERCQGSACSNFVQIATSTTTTYSDLNLTAAANYRYRLRAQDAANNVSAYSTITTVATQYAGPITFNYSYDNLGRVTRASGSDGSLTDYSYDANGNVTSINRQ